VNLHHNQVGQREKDQNIISMNKIKIFSEEMGTISYILCMTRSSSLFIRRKELIFHACCVHRRTFFIYNVLDAH
jgi:hypothetical protein